MMSLPKIAGNSNAAMYLQSVCCYLCRVLKELLHKISCYIALPVLGYNKGVGIFPYKYPVQMLRLRSGGKKSTTKWECFETS